MVEHWFDFICPFCYVGQSRTAILRAAGLVVDERALAIHPEIGPGGAPAPDRHGVVYERLAAEARRADLALRWTDRIPFSRPALIVSELVRRDHRSRHDAFVASVFDAYFAQGRDIERADVLTESLHACGIDDPTLLAHDKRADGADALTRSRSAAHAAGVTGTPAWLIEGRLIAGLQPDAVFRDLALTATTQAPRTE